MARYVTAKPPTSSTLPPTGNALQSTETPTASPYVPREVQREFRSLLDDIHALDLRHGDSTPSRTLHRIMLTARRLGVPPEELVGNGQLVDIDDAV